MTGTDDSSFQSHATFPDYEIVSTSWTVFFDCVALKRLKNAFLLSRLPNLGRAYL